MNTLVGPDMGALVITHYQRILDYVQPDVVHVFVDGRIVESGGPELAHRLGYSPTGIRKIAHRCLSALTHQRLASAYPMASAPQATAEAVAE